MSTIEFIAIGSGGLGLAIWIYLLLFHGRFWRADQRLEAEQVAPDDELSSLTVFAVVPARNEADVIDRAVKSLLTQSNPAISQVFLVDDRSTDGTADAAWRGAVAAEAEQPGAGDRLTILSGADRPAGWTGKMWAVHQGVEAALSIEQRPDFLLLTDADIEHDFGLLRALLKKAVGADGGTPRVLTSLMVKLHARSALERFLIPAFVFFFQMLFPFRRVNDSNDKMAGAAGGCMLVETKTFLASGGIEAIRGEIIDDCALGRSMKQQGPIWLGLTSSARSLRPYDGLGDVWKMVARTAYTQLNYSPI
ncbi:MAG: glycosyltransferase, partial [Pseudomonadota bacterium]